MNITNKKLSGIIPTVYNGGIRLKHDITPYYRSSRDGYVWIETVFGVKFEIGKYHCINGCAWQVYHIHDADNVNKIEILFTRIEGRRRVSRSIILRKEQLAAAKQI